MSPRDEEAYPAAWPRQQDLLDILSTGEPPAFATTQSHRITFWNSGAARILGRPAEQVLGAHCHEIIRGRDLFGNLFCYENCPLVATARRGEPISQCEFEAPRPDGEKRTLAVTTIELPGSRPETFTLVHLLQPLASVDRLKQLIQELPVPSFVARPGHNGANGHAAGNGCAAAEAGAPGPDAADPPLTAREREILTHVASGLQNKEIAQRLDISLATVRNHVHNVLDKLGVHSKLEAVCLAFRSGWVEEGGAGTNTRARV